MRTFKVTWTELNKWESIIEIDDDTTPKEDIVNKYFDEVNENAENIKTISSFDDLEIDEV